MATLNMGSFPVVFKTKTFGADLLNVEYEVSPLFMSRAVAVSIQQKCPDIVVDT